MSEEEWASLLNHLHGATVADKPPETADPGKHIWEQSGEWDEAAIPPRDWIAKGYILRNAVTVLAGSGSAGKSSLSVCYAIALALARTWSRFKSATPCRVMLYNTEDDDEEQRRRFSAALRQFKATPADLAGRIYRVGPQAIGTLIERDPSTGRLSLTDVMADIERRVAETRPDVLFADPLIELHNADENDNTAQRSIIAFFRILAVRYQMGIVLVHHARKGSAAAAGDPDMIRGAGAIVGACRVALTVAVMTEDEAQALNVNPADRHDYFRVDGAKSNYARIETAEWFRRAVYDLANGDQVAAPVPWSAVKPISQIAVSDISQALDAIEKGFDADTPFTASRRGENNHRWAGYVLIRMLKLDEAAAADLISQWLRNKVLVQKTYRDKSQSKDRTGLFIGDRNGL